MKNILVTGATGFIGSALVQQLIDLGHTPAVLVRRPLRRDLFPDRSVRTVFGDLTRPETLAAATAGVDTVFHLGARATFESYATLRPTIVEGSRALMQAALKAGATTFVHASSLLVYAGQEEPITRETVPRPRLDYGRAKLEAEESLSGLARGTHLTLAMVRLPHVYGARDLLFNEIRKGRVIVPGNGRNRYAHLHVRDAARLMTAVADSGWTGAAPTADELPADWNTFLQVVHDHYPRFDRVHLPMHLARALALLSEAYARLRRRQTLHTPGAILGWNLNLPVAPGLIWDDLGLTPDYPTIHQGIPAALNEKVSFRWCHPVCDTVACPDCPPAKRT